MSKKFDTIVRGGMVWEIYDTVVCPMCDEVTPIGEHCIYCGEPLSQMPVLLPSAKCQRCGMYGPSGDYCGACGGRLVPKPLRQYLMSDEVEV